MLQRAAHQDMAIAARNRVAPLGQHHAGKEIRIALVEDHLPLYRLDWQFQPKLRQQLSAPCSSGQHDRLRTDLTL
ncbi:hypothetical protein D3C78_1480290 [compost metagenome]